MDNLVVKVDPYSRRNHWFLLQGIIFFAFYRTEIYYVWVTTLYGTSKRRSQIPSVSIDGTCHPVAVYVFFFVFSPLIFSLIRRQFLRKVWPIHLAFLRVSVICNVINYSICTLNCIILCNQLVSQIIAYPPGHHVIWKDFLWLLFCYLQCPLIVFSEMQSINCCLRNGSHRLWWNYFFFNLLPMRSGADN